MSAFDLYCENLLAGVPGRTPGRLELDRRVVEGLDVAWDEVRGLAGREGWLCLSDRVARCPAQVDPEPGVFPLDGEWVLDRDRSVHLRHLGDGRWAVTTLTRRPDPAPEGGYLVTRRFVARGGGGLAYDVEWRLADDAFGLRAYRPWAARFAGFDPDAGKGGRD